MVELRPELLWFAEQMELALRVNDFKGGWKNDDQIALLHRIMQEVGELRLCLQPHIAGTDPAGTVKEAADVANFAMMIADNYRNRLSVRQGAGE